MTSIIKSPFLTLAATVACLFVAVSGSLAESARRQPKTASTPTANFSFDDGSGQADAGSYPAGAHFTFSINLNFAPGGNVANLLALSYWFEQQSPLAPFYFSITNRNVAGSLFTDLQTKSLTYPQSLAPSNPNDLGAFTDGPSLGAGTYFIANVTIFISPLATPGTYILENVTSGGKTSVIFDDQGHGFNIPHASYTLTVVPFSITSISQLANEHILVQGKGVPSVVNRIEASPDLSPNSFQTLGPVTPDATGAFSFEDTTPGTLQFYRLAYP